MSAYLECIKSDSKQEKEDSFRIEQEIELLLLAGEDPCLLLGRYINYLALAGVESSNLHLAIHKFTHSDPAVQAALVAANAERLSCLRHQEEQRTRLLLIYRLYCSASVESMSFE